MFRVATYADSHFNGVDAPIIPAAEPWDKRRR
jgi:hypothetical protein